MGGDKQLHTHFFFCIHHTPFHYFMPMPLILFVLSQHFMTQINIFYLCHTYAIISIKKIAQLLIMPIMAGHLVLRWEIWHANPPISYYKLFGHYKLAYSICKNFHMSHISKFHSQLAKSKHEIFTHALSHEINIGYNI